MKKYEIMLILNPDISDTDIEVEVNKIKDSIVKLKGKVIQFGVWQRRKLAYPINKFQEGLYLQGEFKMPESIVKGLSEDWQLDSKILRFLILKKEREGDSDA
jgi:small subunit ribosomal protein S6